MKVAVARGIPDALAALSDATERSRVLSGGTDLVVEMESGRTRPDLVIEVSRVREIRYVRATQGGLEIGAGATCTDLLRSADVHRIAPPLAAAAREVGAVQIQNRATLGGNLCTASPAADLVPVLFALGARVRLASRRGERELDVESFTTGYRATARATDELVTSIAIPAPAAGLRSAFRKVGTRRAQSISKLVLAIALGPEGARVAAGSVAERTLRLTSVERAIEDVRRGRLARRDLADALRRAADADVRPRDDVRSTARYRRAALGNLLVRLLDFDSIREGIPS